MQFEPPAKARSRTKRGGLIFNPKISKRLYTHNHFIFPRLLRALRIAFNNLQVTHSPLPRPIKTVSTRGVTKSSSKNYFRANLRIPFCPWDESRENNESELPCETHLELIILSAPFSWNPLLCSRHSYPFPLLSFPFLSFSLSLRSRSYFIRSFSTRLVKKEETRPSLFPGFCSALSRQVVRKPPALPPPPDTIILFSPNGLFYDEPFFSKGCPHGDRARFI